MAQEIERKFLVVSGDWREAAGRSVLIRQGYLSNTGKSSVRVRIAGDRANLNIKSATIGICRQEFEYAIPVDDAAELLRLSDGAVIEKTRYFVNHAGHLWEVDEFGGANAGLVVAEIELGDIDECFERPSWAGDEVSDDPRYYNVRLALEPYTSWPV